MLIREDLASLQMEREEVVIRNRRDRNDKYRLSYRIDDPNALEANFFYELDSMEIFPDIDW